MYDGDCTKKDITNVHCSGGRSKENRSWNNGKLIGSCCSTETARWGNFPTCWNLKFLIICDMIFVKVREIQNIAKKRAIERRERERLREGSSSRQRKSEPNILERTVKCCLLNGVVFAMSIVLFESVLLPLIQTLLYIILAGSQSRADALWSYTQPVLSVAFSTLWVLPFFLLSKVVNAIWFQDIADLAFR